MVASSSGRGLAASGAAAVNEIMGWAGATMLATQHKAAIIRPGTELGVPLGATLSCVNPRDGVDCGPCSKCRERCDAFAGAGVPQPTEYRAPSPESGV